MFVVVVRIAQEDKCLLVYFSDGVINLNGTGVTSMAQSMHHYRSSRKKPVNFTLVATQIMDTCDAHSCVLADVRTADDLFTFWSFDSNVFDRQNRSNGIAVNQPFYFPEYAGSGQCIFFNGVDQYAVAPYIPFNNRSFTLEVFVFFDLLLDDAMFPILSQCATTSGTYQCLTMGVKNSKLYFSFSNDDQVGTTTLLDTRW